MKIGLYMSKPVYLPHVFSVNFVTKIFKSKNRTLIQNQFFEMKL